MRTLHTGIREFREIGHFYMVHGTRSRSHVRVSARDMAARERSRSLFRIRPLRRTERRGREFSFDRGRTAILYYAA